MAKNKTVGTQSQNDAPTTDETNLIDGQLDGQSTDETTDADADADADKPDAEPEPTSEKLEQLRAEQLKLEDLIPTFKPRSVEQKTAFNRIIAIDGEIVAEQANIKNQIAQAAIDAYNSKQYELLQSVIDLRLVEIAKFAEFEKLPLDADGKRDAVATDEMNAATAAAKNAFETVVNRLIGKTKSVATGSTAATQTGGKSEILQLHLANIAAGKTDADSRAAIQAAGYPRSTVWHTINNYNKSK